MTFLKRITRNMVYNEEKDEWQKQKNSHIWAHIDRAGIDTSTQYVLIDLSDTTNWPHMHTGSLGLLGYEISADPNDTFEGVIRLGFLDNVDEDNGDFYNITSYRMVKKADTIKEYVSFPGKLILKPENVADNTTEDSTDYQTDTDLDSPKGSVAPETGDMVVTVTRNSGEVGISISVQYISYD